MSESETLILLKVVAGFVIGLGCNMVAYIIWRSIDEYGKIQDSKEFKNSIFWKQS